MQEALMGEALQAGSNLTGNLINSASEMTTNYMNARENKKNRDWNLKMWQMQNDYNTPSAQMARYKTAGLNPNLMYSQGNGGNAGSVAASSPVTYRAPTVDMPNIMGILQAAQQMQLVDEELTKRQYETGIAKENYKASHLNNEFIYGPKSDTLLGPNGNGMFRWVMPEANVGGTSSNKPYYVMKYENELSRQRADINNIVANTEGTSKANRWINLEKKGLTDERFLGNILKGQEANIKGELNRYNMNGNEKVLWKWIVGLINKGVDAANPSGKRNYVQNYSGDINNPPQ